MRLKLTLARPSGPSDDIVISCDGVATVADVAATVARLDPRRTAVGSPAVSTLAVARAGAAPDILDPELPIAEARLGDGATVSVVDAASRGHAQSASSPVLARLRIVAGPGAGRSVDVRAGAVVIGRDPRCDIVLNDAMVSGRHARLQASAAGVELVDLGSANGLVVDGGLVGRIPVQAPVRVLIGDTEVEIAPTAVLPGAGAGAGAGTAAGAAALVPLPLPPGPVAFNRSPRVEQRYVGVEFTVPEVPKESDPQPLSLIALISPMLLSGVMYVFTHQPTTLLFALATPVMALGNWWTRRRNGGRLRRREIELFETDLADLESRLAEEQERERAQRLLETPSTGEAYEAGIRRTPLLWTRRPEHWSFLNVRLGTGSMPSRSPISSRGAHGLLRAYQERLDAVLARFRTVPGVPVTENLYDAGAIGVAGAPADVAGAVNSLLVQLTALHSPAELVVSALVGTAWSAPLGWLKWLPHTSSAQSPLEGGHLADSASSAVALLARLEAVVAARLGDDSAARRGALAAAGAALERGADVEGNAADGTPSPVPAVIVVISDDAPVDRGRLVQLAESAADAGVFPIWIGPDLAALPAVCRTHLELFPDGRARAGLVRLGEAIEDVVVEPLGTEHVQAFAHALAPVSDASAVTADASDLPQAISLVTLLGHELAESSDAVVDRWRQNDSIHNRAPGIQATPRRAGRLRAIVGSAGADVMHLDLRTQGPHALVGGTTGSGKSEFLQAWVLGMAAEYSPDRVSFLFVDYKGGSAFADCVELPHCVGLVTDLSPHLVRRALTSLRAELRHREHLLNRKKAKDLIELEKRGDPECPPALVLVIDEFAALVGEVPEFVDGVVDIAQRGRSLGIHLIMATQRPAGVIRDNLRANTNLRVALRMADESDAQDVVGVKDAARIDPSLPGRGYAKTGPGRLSAFQSGYAGGWTSREPEQRPVEVAELRFGGEVKWDAAGEASGAPVVAALERDPGPTDQQRLVAAMRGAQTAAGIPQPRRPWLDELAPVYDLGLLRQRSDTELLLGVADLPALQEQRPVYFQPDVDGHLSVYGTGGSGKSTVLRTLACAAAITPRGGPVHVYALDFAAGSLRSLEALPHVGSVVAGDDSERVVRLMRMLQGELARRAELFTTANASTITEYRAASGDAALPRLLLLVDGLQGFRDEFEGAIGRSVWWDVFRDILVDGRRLGIHVVLTADRPGAVPSSISSSIQRRVVLRLNEEAYLVLGAPRDVIGPSSPAGRAIVDDEEVQIAILGGDGTISGQTEAMQRLAAAMDRAGAVPAPPIGALPKEYPLSELPASVDGMPVLGLADADLGPFAFLPEGALMVGGGPGSGRTTAVRSIAESVGRALPDARRYLIGPRRSPLVGALEWEGTASTTEEVVALARNLLAAVQEDDESDGTIAVFIESLGDYLQTPADAPLVELTKAIKRSAHLLVAEADSSTWASSWPLFAEIKNGRRGLLLQPDPMDGDMLLKTPLPRTPKSEFPPGRGVYIERGSGTRVQLPLP